MYVERNLGKVFKMKGEFIMDREQELMDIIEYSNDAEKKAAAAKELTAMRKETAILNPDNDTIDIRDILKAF